VALSHRGKEKLPGYAAITEAELAEGRRLQRQKLARMIGAPIAIIIMIVFGVIINGRKQRQCL
jgi:hypothetical protein